MTGVRQFPDGATPLDPNDLGGLKFKHITLREELDELEQANIESGLRWLARQRRDVLTDAFAVTLHKRLFGEVWDWAGTFRKTGANICIDPILIAVELQTAMDNARYWVEHKTYPSWEAAARLHHRLVQIHPFPNGNGRHARIMADALLNRVYQAKPIDWAAGHNLQKMNDCRLAYLAALKAADREDFSLLLSFVAPRGEAG